MESQKDAEIVKMPHSSDDLMYKGKTVKDCPYAAKLHRKKLLADKTTKAEVKQMITDRLEKNVKGETATPPIGNRLRRQRQLQADGRLYLSDYMTCPRG